MTLDLGILDMTPKVKFKKNGKNFCTLKNTIKTVKRQPTEWENIFANHISNQGLHPEYYKELSQLKNKMTE